MIAIREALPEGTSIRYTAHNGRIYDGVVVYPYNGTGFIKVQSLHTRRSYWIGLNDLEGLI